MQVGKLYLHGLVHGRELKLAVGMHAVLVERDARLAQPHALLRPPEGVVRPVGRYGCNDYCRHNELKYILSRKHLIFNIQFLFLLLIWYKIRSVPSSRPTTAEFDYKGFGYKGISYGYNNKYISKSKL